jgi:hypothetical protein
MMRGLFLALVLVNLGVFAWYHWYAEDSGPEPSAAPGGAPLQLMSELTPEQKKTLAAQTASVAPPAVAAAPATAVTAPGLTAPTGNAALMSCASYGPFPDADAAQKAAAKLKQAGVATSEHSVAGKARLGYWVYLPPFGSRKEAEAAAKLLQQKGVKDLYVVTDEANRNAISLGLYSQHGGAEEHQKEIRKLGYRARIAERFRDEPRYWVEGRAAAGALLQADAFKELAEDGSSIGRLACPP